ncbi:hypothetical protein [Streptomyces sp. NPDC050485]|uniref:hypothetical protein n=1 Tax=Streptomyces sp. NPDC050485 TaxID=3365617 RepID=UPI0037A7DA96
MIDPMSAQEFAHVEQTGTAPAARLANFLLGWACVGPFAALITAIIAVKEGRDAWHGRGSCAQCDERKAAAQCMFRAG